MGVFTLRSSLDVDVNEVPDLTGVVGLLVFLEHLLQELVDRRKDPHQSLHHLPHAQQGIDHKALHAFFKNFKETIRLCPKKNGSSFVQHVLLVDKNLQLRSLF